MAVAETAVIDGEVLSKYDVTEAALSEMKSRLIVPDVKTKEGYEFARKGIAECRCLRVAVEKRRKELKADALEFGRKVDAVAKALTSQLEAIEGPLQAAKDEIDEAAERAKREKEEAERKAREEADRKQREDEQRKLAEERAAIEAERRKIEAEQAEFRRKQAEEQAKLDAVRRAIEDEKRRIELEQAKKNAAEQAAAAERERIERERIEAERLAKEKAEREAAEAARRESLKPDRQKVVEWVNRIVSTPAPEVETEVGKTKVMAVAASLAGILRHVQDEANWK